MKNKIPNKVCNTVHNWPSCCMIPWPEACIISPVASVIGHITASVRSVEYTILLFILFSFGDCLIRACFEAFHAAYAFFGMFDNCVPVC